MDAVEILKKIQEGRIEVLNLNCTPVIILGARTLSIVMSYYNNVSLSRIRGTEPTQLFGNKVVINQNYPDMVEVVTSE